MISHERFIGHNLRYLERDRRTASRTVRIGASNAVDHGTVLLPGFQSFGPHEGRFPESQETAMADMREVGPTFTDGAPCVGANCG